MNREPIKDRPFVIAPSILSADFTRLGEQLAEVEAAGANWIHIDVMDGHFVPNLTMGPFIVEHVRRTTSLPLDVHLMVTNPEQHLKAFVDAGANSLTVHVEAVREILPVLETIHGYNCMAGVTLNPPTPASALADVIGVADLVLVMTVYPGYSGQAFMPDMVAKVAEVRQMLDSIGSQAWLEVDGGISASTIKVVWEAGANAFVAANAIFKHPGGIAAGISSLRHILGVDRDEEK